MTSAKNSLCLFIAILFTVMTNAQTNTAPVDRLGIKGPINFNNSVYNLSWSSHPSATYYKQEYLPKGEDANKFKSMVMVEAVTGSIVLKNVVDAKITELKSLGATNHFISYEKFYNDEKNEYLLDFVITQNSPDNKSALIAERNVYRYKKLASNNGIMLFAISTRSYGADTKAFLAAVKSDRKTLVDKMRAFSLPSVNVQ
jgi:hypothetical protein